MNTEIRQLFEQLLQVLNNNNSPIEAKRFVLVTILNLVEKKSDDAIRQEIQDTLDKIEIKEEVNVDAESIYKDKLEKLSK